MNLIFLRCLYLTLRLLDTKFSSIKSTGDCFLQKSATPSQWLYGLPIASRKNLFPEGEKEWLCRNRVKSVTTRSPRFWASHCGQTRLGSARIIFLEGEIQNRAFSTKINMATKMRLRQAGFETLCILNKD